MTQLYEAVHTGLLLEDEGPDEEQDGQEEWEVEEAGDPVGMAVEVRHMYANGQRIFFLSLLVIEK